MRQHVPALRTERIALPVDALYLHIPFCFHKCHYCDFYSVVEPAHREQERFEQFTEALIREIHALADRLDTTARAPLASLFVGGGTPTLLPAVHWQRLLASLRSTGLLQPGMEFTVEANPETVHAELADTLVAGGVNRISIGAQSFDPRHLKTLERWHDPASVPRAVTTLRQAGIHRLNLDLIFAIPGQSLGDLHADLDAALACEPTHLSCYGLTYEPNTALHTRLRNGSVTAAPEELERAMYEQVMDRLAAEGFEHYEVSAWARRATPSEQCRHNLTYWSNGHWLGLGPGAASHLDGWRWKNKPHLPQYLATSPHPPVMDVESLAPADRIGETLMLRLRLRQGVPMSWIQQHLDPADERHQTFAQMQELGLMTLEDHHLRLTRNGLLVADAVIARLL